MNSKTSLIALSCMLVLAVIGSISSRAQEETRGNNPNYPKPNPFYFEGKIDYELLGIDTPRNAWEYTQRGIHKQDDLEDFEGAIADYRTAISMNSLQNGTCQIVTAAPVPPSLDAMPCMFTVRSRLGFLLMEKDPEEAIRLFQEVLLIDPLRLEMNAMIGEALVEMGDRASAETGQQRFYEAAVNAFKAELELSPVTPEAVQWTGDQANNAQVHWELADVYEKLDRKSDAKSELALYLAATQWHSDTYPWRIALAEKRIEGLSQ
jgi:tetratricopeptide (TPR) repeat protein